MIIENCPYVCDFFEEYKIMIRLDWLYKSYLWIYKPIYR